LAFGAVGEGDVSCALTFNEKGRISAVAANKAKSCPLRPPDAPIIWKFIRKTLS
jgi:hypothetical protein